VLRCELKLQYRDVIGHDIMSRDAITITTPFLIDPGEHARDDFLIRPVIIKPYYYYYYS